MMSSVMKLMWRHQHHNQRQSWSIDQGENAEEEEEEEEEERTPGGDSGMILWLGGDDSMLLF